VVKPLLLGRRGTQDFQGNNIEQKTCLSSAEGLLERQTVRKPCKPCSGSVGAQPGAHHPSAATRTHRTRAGWAPQEGHLRPHPPDQTTPRLDRVYSYSSERKQAKVVTKYSRRPRQTALAQLKPKRLPSGPGARAARLCFSLASCQYGAPTRPPGPRFRLKSSACSWACR
jgi:hypothetical protein